MECQYFSKSLLSKMIMINLINKYKKFNLSKKNMLKLNFDDDPESIEAGIDEAGRGCLSGRVYCAACILPKMFPEGVETYKEIKDSKKISRKKRAELRKFIEENAIAYSVAYAEPNEVDEKNINTQYLNK